jgi:superfamily II DNA/RNA helicase
LLSAEIVSHGLDFPDLWYIILSDIQPTIIDYVSRIGRTAKMNNNSVSLLILNYHESAYIKQVILYM